MNNPNNSWRNAPTQPSRRADGWYPPEVRPQSNHRAAPPYGEDPRYDGYGRPISEHEILLERQLAQAEGRANVLERNSRRLEQQLVDSRERLYQWRINIRNGLIAFLTIFIAVWASVSVIVRYPVLPWDMPSVILGLLGH